MKNTLTIVLVAVILCAARAAANEDVEPWAAPRELSAFQSLLDRSPFSLPTAEESSPLAERYALTGAVAIDGDPIVFIMDRTTQARHMLSKKVNEQNMSLVEYLPDPDARRMRATIRVGEEVATIAYVEPANSEQPPTNPAGPGNPVPAASGSVINAPAPVAPGQPGAPVVTQGGDQQTPQPPRRIIRRRIISGQGP